MSLSGGVLALTIALLCAQGPRAAAAKRAKPSPSTVTAEKKVIPPVRPRPTSSPKRRDSSLAVSPIPTGTTTPDDASGNPSGNPTGTTEGRTPPNPVKSAKTKVYTFGAMDVEGKLKTPQLLYFLNRVKLELEMSAPDHRSFMKELEKTAEDSNL